MGGLATVQWREPRTERGLGLPAMDQAIDCGGYAVRQDGARGVDGGRERVQEPGGELFPGAARTGQDHRGCEPDVPGSAFQLQQMSRSSVREVDAEPVLSIW